MIESPTKAIPVSALSAIGSAILPKSVTRLRLRAMSPSTLSVIIATDEERPGDHPPQDRRRRRRRAGPSRRTAPSRCAAWSARWAGSSCWACWSALAARGHADRPRATRSDAVGARRRPRAPGRRRRVAREAGRGGSCRPPPVPGGRRGPRTVVRRRSRLDQHLDLLADPVLGALRGQLLDEAGDVLGARADLVVVELARRTTRPRCRPRRSSRRRRRRRAGPRPGSRTASRRSSSVSPGKPTMTLERIPAGGACARIWSSSPRKLSGSPNRRIRRSTALDGVLEGQVVVGGDARRSPAIAVDQAGPGLGGLQVGHPHPLDAVDGRELGQQRLEEPQVAEVLAVGRGVLADQEQLPDALLGRASGPRRARRSGRRETKEPRKDGIAQNEQRRSQPLASLSGAIGPPSSRRRTARGPDVAGAAPAGRSGAAMVCPGTTTAPASRAGRA